MAQRDSRQSFANIRFSRKLSGLRHGSKTSIIATPTRLLNSGSSLIDFSEYFHVDQSLDEKLNDNGDLAVKQRMSKFAEGAVLDASRTLAPRRKIAIEEITQDQLLEMAISILQKPTQLRNPNEIKLLIKATGNISFFQQLVIENGPETHELCAKNMTHKYAYKNDVVFSLGSVGTTFYVILRGSVSVWVNIPKVPNNDEPASDGNKSPIQELTEIKTLIAGESFGELALMDNKPRAATIICKENTHFAILEKTPFNKILRDNQTKKLFAQIEFFASLKIFSDWTYNSVKNLYYYTTHLETIRNQVIYKSKDEATNVYMIKKGEFKMRCILKIEQKKESEGLASIGKGTMKKGFDLAVLGPCEMFGEEEILEDSKRMASVTCVSNTGSLFVLSKKEFVRRVLTDENTKRSLFEQLKIKKKWREKRIKEYMNAIDISKGKEPNERKSILALAKTEKVHQPTPHVMISMTEIPANINQSQEGVFIPPLDLNLMSIKKVSSDAAENLADLSAGLKTDKSKKSLKDGGGVCTFRSQLAEADDNYSFNLKSVKNLHRQSVAIKERDSISIKNNQQFFQKIQSITPFKEISEGQNQKSPLPYPVTKRQGLEQIANISNTISSFDNLNSRSQELPKSFSSFQSANLSSSLKEKVEARIKEKNEKFSENNNSINITLRKYEPPDTMKNFLKNSSENEEINKLSAFRKINQIQLKYSKTEKNINRTLQEILLTNKEKKNREYREKRIKDFFEMKQKVISKIEARNYKMLSKNTTNYNISHPKKIIHEQSHHSEISLPEIVKKEDTSSSSLKLNKSLLPLKYIVEDLRALKEANTLKFRVTKRNKIQSTLKEITASSGVKNY